MHICIRSLMLFLGRRKRGNRGKRGESPSDGGVGVGQGTSGSSSTWRAARQPHTWRPSQSEPTTLEYGWSYFSTNTLRNAAPRGPTGHDSRSLDLPGTTFHYSTCPRHSRCLFCIWRQTQVVCSCLENCPP